MIFVSTSGVFSPARLSFLLATAVRPIVDGLENPAEAASFQISSWRLSFTCTSSWRLRTLPTCSGLAPQGRRLRNPVLQLRVRFPPAEHLPMLRYASRVLREHIQCPSGRGDHLGSRDYWKNVNLSVQHTF
jgi:hypothetical protein